MHRRSHEVIRTASALQGNVKTPDVGVDLTVIDTAQTPSKSDIWADTRWASGKVTSEERDMWFYRSKVKWKGMRWQKCDFPVSLLQIAASWNGTLHWLRESSRTCHRKPMLTEPWIGRCNCLATKETACANVLPPKQTTLFQQKALLPLTNDPDNERWCLVSGLEAHPSALVPPKDYGRIVHVDDRWIVVFR